MSQTLPPRSAGLDTQSFHILVIDDDTTILSLVRDVLLMVPGCRVSTAANPADAMQIVVKGDVDIIFTDIHMPGVTGLELLKDIVALQKCPEVIVMTAYPSSEIANEAMELGATSLIAKPFDDIALVELELEKAIKRILRQRNVAKESAAAKSPKAAPPVHADPLKKLSVGNLIEDAKTMVSPREETAVPQNPFARPEPKAPIVEPAPAVATPAVRPGLPAGVQAVPMDALPPRKIYAIEYLEPLIEVEMPRSLRYNRPFALGYVDIPESLQATLPSEQEKYRRQQVEKIERSVRRSDVMIDAGRDGVAVILYECNRLGAEVVEHKLRTSGFQHTGFKIFPQDAKQADTLIESAKKGVQNKRKFQIVLLEAEEFFGRIVQNMLLDPKYFVNWVRSVDDAYKLVSREAEGLRLLLMSLTKDTRQWELLLKFKKENLVQWPIVLFVDIPLTTELKKQLRSLGVRAVVNKSISQEEFIYIVQSFVLPRPQIDERRNVRALVAVPTVYEVGGTSLSSNSFTLSRDGVFIRDMNPPTSGTPVRVKLYIPGLPGPLDVSGEVIYAVPYFVGVNRFHVSGFAVKFSDLEASKKDIVEQFVQGCLTTYLI